jgi:hypothetical protein
MRFGLPAFVFHWVGAPGAGLAFVQFDHIGDAGNAEPCGSQRHAGHATYAAPDFGFFGMHSFMCNAPFGGCDIFRPLLFDVDQRALPRAEEVVLEGGERDEIGVGYHSLSLRDTSKKQKPFDY